MSNQPEDEALRHVVIVRRKRGDHDDHHGGAWKIAYADFMTAMMAFFLVMWLVNMTDDKKIVQIAAYFNPLRLSDRSPSSKGLQDAAKEDPPQLNSPAKEKDKGGSGKEGGEGSKEKAKAETKKDQKSKVKAAHVESELFVDPMKTIEKIAEKAPPQPPFAGAGAKPWGHPSATSGKALLDPFDPITRGHNHKPSAERAPIAEKTKSAAPEALKRKPADVAGKELVQEPAKKSSGQPDSPTSSTVDPALDAANKIAPSIEREIKAAMVDFNGPLPQIVVKATAEGVLIRLADDADFGMFAIASAEPLPVTVQMMDRIGEILKDRVGAIVVRGHTDGRPYRSGSYDNWRLSTARAHMAQYMLQRAGVDATRIVKVEGHADRSLLDAKDKEAAQNRRIEILLSGAPP